MPDIDLDFPRDIREQLIVARAPSATDASTPRSWRASRPTARAARSATSARRSGSPYAELERLARVSDGWNATRVADELDALPECRARPSPALARLRRARREIAGLPRHISQHPGGMVISSRPLVELVPVKPAAMAGRQLCQWDKDSAPTPAS